MDTNTAIPQAQTAPAFFLSPPAASANAIAQIFFYSTITDTWSRFDESNQLIAISVAFTPATV